MPARAAPAHTAPAATGPRVVELAAGSTLLPAGASAASAAAPAGPQAAATPAAGEDAGSATSDSKAAPAPQQARRGVALLGRLLGVMPLAAGLTQIMLGLMITRGTVSIAAVPLLGSLPKFLVGGLVASTATPSLMGGIMKLLGKDAPPQTAPGA